VKLRRRRTQQEVPGVGSGGQGGSSSGVAGGGELRKASDNTRCLGIGKKDREMTSHLDVRLQREEQRRGGRDGEDWGPVAPAGGDAPGDGSVGDGR
jgi:hypothetical protein